MSTTQLQAERVRSQFVTVLAWVFIILSGFSTFISILQNIMVQAMFSGAEMQQALQAAKQDQNAPYFATFMFEHFQWFFVAILVLSSGTLACSIGLLKRHNWARVGFVAILALGIVWNIAGFVLQLIVFTSMSPIPADASNEFRSQFGTMFAVMAVFGAVMVIGFSVLFGWIIKRLVSLPVRREFGAAV